MMTFLLVIQALVAAAMVGVILMQRSEGGGLGMGGSPTGLMSARGAADFLTRATTVLASVFVVLCIVLAVIAAQRAAPGTIDTSLRQVAPVAPQQPSVPLGGDPLAAAANSAAVAPAPAVQTPPAAPAPAPSTRAAPAADKPASAAPARPRPAPSAAPIAPPPAVVPTTPGLTPAPAGNGN